MSNDHTEWFERGLERGLNSGLLWLVLCCFAMIYHSCTTEHTARLDEVEQSLTRTEKALAKMDSQARMVEQALDRWGSR